MEQLGTPQRLVGAGPPMRVGLLGCGTVGSEVARILLASETWTLERVAVLDVRKERGVHLPAELLTDDPLAVVKDPDIDVIVELIGGLDPARWLLRQAIAEGKDVVTANKALLARTGPLLHEAAVRRKVALLYEGAACAGIPVVRTLRTIAASDRVRSITGVLNGTTNFVLGEIEKGRSQEDAIDLARANGFAEADCSSDIEGQDAASKLALLAGLAFGTDVPVESIACRGITELSVREVRAALREGERVKLVARTDRRTDGRITATVAPVRLPAGHPLARLDGAQNGVLIHTELAGTVSLFGEGAGGRPTAAAVMSDLHEIKTFRRRPSQLQPALKGDASR